MYENINFDILNLSEIKGPNKLKVFDKYGLEAPLTDYALHTDEVLESIPSYYTVKNDEDQFQTIKDNIIGDAGRFSTGIRPVIRDKDLYDKAALNREINDDGQEVYKFGEYPQKRVSEDLAAELDHLYFELNEKKEKRMYNLQSKVQDFMIENRLSKTQVMRYTGKSYACPRIYQVWDDDRYYVDRRHFDEVEYKGKKYVRYHESDRYYSFAGWYEVSPVEWLIDDNSKTLVSKNTIIKNIDNQNYYKYSVTKKFIENLSKDLYPSKTITKTEEQRRKFKDVDEVKNEVERNLEQEKLNEKKKEEIYKNIMNALENIKNSTEQLEKINGVETVKNLYHTINIPEEMLIKQIEDHKEISSEFLQFLRFINLSTIDVTNLKVSGIDFRNTNIIIDPQKVYNKDLSNSKFEDLNLSGNFKDVNLSGADISKEKMPVGIEKAITDEKTKLAEWIEKNKEIKR